MGDAFIPCFRSSDIPFWFTAHSHSYLGASLAPFSRVSSAKPLLDLTKRHTLPSLDSLLWPFYVSHKCVWRAPRRSTGKPTRSPVYMRPALCMMTNPPKNFSRDPRPSPGGQAQRSSSAQVKGQTGSSQRKGLGTWDVQSGHID